MKKKSKLSLLLSLIMLLALFIFSGCALGTSKEEILKENNLQPIVTYYINGYSKNANEIATFRPFGKSEIDVYYSVGTTPYEIKDTGKVKVSFENHVFLGWFEVKCNEQGKPIVAQEITDENGNVFVLYETEDTPADFEEPLKENEHRHYAAKWDSGSKVNVKLVLSGADDGEQISLKKEEIPNSAEFDPVKDKDTVIVGDTLFSYSYTKGTITQITDYDIIKDYTFFGYYTDAECTTEVNFPLKQTEEDIDIYAKFIKGNWTFVSDKSGVSAIFSNAGSSSKKFYLVNNIDCKGLTVSALTEFACEVQGNGYTLKNLTVNKARDKAVYSVFGQIKETAVIKNLIFENLTFTCRFSQASDDKSYYFVFTALHENAKIENVTFIGGAIKAYNLGRDDIPLSNLMEKTNYLFGGYDTDNAYKISSENKGFIVEQEPTVETGLL